MNNSHWSQYWAAGNLTSLPADFEKNYDGAIANFWHSVFTTIADEAVVLDVCSGNGAIAILAAEYASNNNKTWRIIATDRAIIDLAAVAQQFVELKPYCDSIEVMDETAIEDLELPDQSVDLITSQYGIEYSDLAVSAKKLWAALKRQGTLAIMSHSSDTSILEKMKQEASHYKVLDDAGLFKRLPKLLKHNPGQKELQAALLPVGEELRRSLLTANSPVLRPMFDLVRFVFSSNPTDVHGRKKEIYEFLISLQSGYARLNDLLGLHQRFQESPNWIDAFTQSGFKLVEQDKVLYQGNIPAGDTYLLKTE